ncbi:MAG TPA: S41 family peptidase [Verrucomicrobiae bacterium]|nr:S41 family peptidase [Verrucomicrobiae bacterium]
MRYSCGAILAITLSVAAFAQPTLSPAQRQLNIESFEQVWKTVREKHWDPKLNGVDWQAVHDELRPAIEKAATMDEARDIMSDMLGRLKQTHFGIVPGDAYTELDQKDETGKSNPPEGGPGLDLRWVDGHALVTFVAPDSPAAAKGVKPGWEILRIDRKDLAPGMAKVHAVFGSAMLAELLETRSVLEHMDGPLDKTVDVEFLDGTDRKIDLQLSRTGPRGIETVVGTLPPLHFWVETRKVQSDIGYIRFNMFFEPDAVNSAVEKIMSQCRDCKGFIVDLRGNPGGLGAMAMGLAGWFTRQSGLMLGTMYLRTASIKFAVFPRPEPFLGPLAVLVDGCSASTSEIFAGGMQDLKRARIFGTHTAGAALPSMFTKLPNGDGFQYAIANYISEGGKPLEGIGVTPDREVKLTRHQLLEGQDPVLDAAVSWIHGQ